MALAPPNPYGRMVLTGAGKPDRVLLKIGN